MMMMTMTTYLWSWW